MDTMNINDENGSSEIPQRAVSLYGQNDGVDDFPVLKAFQQYIDAEQEKARKRILWLGMFFGAVLVVVIIVFMILLHGINMRNQSLSDRLVEYAMKEADRRQSVQPAAPLQQNDAALKAMTEALVAIQKNMETSDKSTSVSQSEKVQKELAAQQESLRLQRLQNQLEVEKKLLADEKEHLRQLEIEQQRRKLYPELYDDSAKVRAPSRSRNLTDDDIREIIREAYPESEYRKREDKSLSDEKQSVRKKSTKAEPEQEESDDAIEYFKDDDYIIPIDVKGAGSKVSFTVPVD